jgi:hypothetical protein
MPTQRIQGHIALLIELFYGLAITEGLAKALPDLLLEFSLLKFSFTAAALFIGLGDWLAYHLIIAPTPYRKLLRLVLDMLFPILIFFIFAATGHPGLDTAAVAVYFAMALLYGFIFRRERPVPGWIFSILLACTVGVLGGKLIDHFYPLSLGDISECIAVAAATLWVIVVLQIVRKELTQNPVEHTRLAVTSEANHRSTLGEAISSILGILVVAATLKSMSRPAQDLKRPPGGII